MRAILVLQLFRLLEERNGQCLLILQSAFDVLMKSIAMLSFEDHARFRIFLLATPSAGNVAGRAVAGGKGGKGGGGCKWRGEREVPSNQ